MRSIASNDLMDYVKIMCDEKWGLSPAGDDGSWFHMVQCPGVTLHIPLKKGITISKQYRYVTEFVPSSTSGSGEVTGEVVIGFGSEEQALLGSQKYIKDPVFPLEKSVLLNMDGVGVGNGIRQN